MSSLAESLAATDLAVSLLKKHEKYMQHPYLDTVGKWTVGYGRNLSDRGLSEEESEYLLRNDIGEAESYLRKEAYWEKLGYVRKAILLDMCVNMGWPRFFKFQQMRAALGAGDYELAADEMKSSRWYSQVGTRGVELVALMRQGRGTYAS